MLSFYTPYLQLLRSTLNIKKKKKAFISTIKFLAHCDGKLKAKERSVPLHHLLSLPGPSACCWRLMTRLSVAAATASHAFRDGGAI